MSKHAYGRTKMRELALTLSEDNLFRNAKIAEQESHLCNHCFNCVCLEVYKDLTAVCALEVDVKIDKIIYILNKDMLGSPI